MPDPGPPGLSFRDRPGNGDPDAIRALVAATGAFSDEEVQVAGRLAESTLDRSAPFLWCLAEAGGRLVGYTCFDHIELTQGSFDLYWIAVAPDSSGMGIGRRLILRTAAAMQALGGTRLYAETSSRPPYAAARAFYRSTGFLRVARFADFYAPGDAKLVYLLRVGDPAAG